ncbi:hypothetical protein [Salmonella phage SSBI34]|nr:hypothetical protein [Salmonella phage SSBI34]
MASNYGLTSSGFNLPALDDLTEETKKAFRQAFGENFNTGSNSVADKLIYILNEREYQLYLLMASVYSAQTMQGAEGIYLDDLLGKRGIYRLGKTRSTGTAVLTVDSSVPYNMIYNASGYSIDGGNYELATDVQVAGNIIAQVIRGTDLAVGNYRLTIQNVNDQSQRTVTHNLTATSGAPLTAFFNVIKDFIVSNTILSNQDRILIDTVEGAIYIGYNTDKEMIGLSSRVDFRTSPLAGNKTILIDVRSVEPGAISREAHSIRSISPTPGGFVSIDNLSAFTDGSDVESDNEYKLRGAMSVNSGKATRPAILSALLNGVEGIEKVRIFNNNTGKTNSLGIPPYRFQVVVYGGTTEQISQVLYDTVAASNNTYGTTFHDITTEDDQVERIWHTKATERRLAIRVRYRGRPLSMTEETAIANGLVTIINGSNIADTIYNVQLVGTVMSSTTPGRFTQVFVDIKNKGAPDSDFINSDITAGVTEVFNLEPEDVQFSQVV